MRMRLTLSNVAYGVTFGLGLATIYSLWALGVFLVAGSRSFARVDTTLGAAVIAYYSAGLLGGVLAGLMLPLGRFLFGAVVLGILVGTVFFFCIEVATSGPFWQWTSTNWKAVLALGAIVGGLCGVGMYSQRGRA
jgi:hypothetical protein